MPGVGASIHRAPNAAAGWSGCQPTATAGMNRPLLVSPTPAGSAHHCWRRQLTRPPEARRCSYGIPRWFRLRWTRSPCGHSAMVVKVQIDISAQLEGNGDSPQMSRVHVYRSAEVMDQLKSSIIIASNQLEQRRRGSAMVGSTDCKSVHINERQKLWKVYFFRPVDCSWRHWRPGAHRLVSRCSTGPQASEYLRLHVALRQPGLKLLGRHCRPRLEPASAWLFTQGG